MGLFRLGQFTLASGITSNFKIDCDALTGDDLEALATIVTNVLPPIREVVSVPTGGDRFAAALRRVLGSFPEYGVFLVVDDVLTTGRNIERRAAILRPYGEVLGLVIFARGPCPGWVTPLFQMSVS